MISIPPRSRRISAFLLAAPIVIAACAGPVSDDRAGGDTAIAEATPVADPAADPASSEVAEDAAGPETWLDIELTDAATGETFTLASLNGRVVAVEPMAIWCSSCKIQQDNVRAAYPEITDRGIHYISLGVDPNEDRAALARYAERREYPWTFAQSPREFSRALADIFGPQILSVPATPLIVLDEAGEIVLQEVGIHGPDRLLELLDEAVA